jgi:hypothetical protein
MNFELMMLPPQKCPYDQLRRKETWEKRSSDSYRINQRREILITWCGNCLKAALVPFTMRPVGPKVVRAALSPEDSICGLGKPVASESRVIVIVNHYDQNLKIHALGQSKRIR